MCWAVMVTLDSSSATHQPPGFWRESRRSTPASSARSRSVPMVTLIGRPQAYEHVEGVWGNREVPPLQQRRGPEGETWFPPRERAEGERRSCSYLQRGRRKDASRLVAAPHRAFHGAGPGGKRCRRFSADPRPEELCLAESGRHLACDQLYKLLPAHLEQLGSAARDHRQVLAALGLVPRETAPVEDPVSRAAEQRGEVVLEQATIEEEMDAHDGRIFQGRSRLTQQAGALRRRNRKDERVCVDSLSVREEGRVLRQLDHPRVRPHERTPFGQHASRSL